MRVFWVVLSSLFGFASIASATETPWQQHLDMLRTRLVVTSVDMANEGQQPLLAWEAELAPGWKTYWRSPGEAGLPVKISDQASEVEILYPVPERFELFGLETYGYSNTVLMPFFVRVESGMNAEVRASFMVCKDICVPFDATYNVPVKALMPEYSPHDIRVAAWLQKVPEKHSDDGAGLEIDDVKVTGRVGRQRIVVKAHADTQLSGADMLAEINEMVHFGAPKVKTLEDGKTALFVLPAITGKDPMDLNGKTVRLTFIDGHGHAIERSIELPAK